MGWLQTPEPQWELPPPRHRSPSCRRSLGGFCVTGLSAWLVRVVVDFRNSSDSGVLTMQAVCWGNIVVEPRDDLVGRILKGKPEIVNLLYVGCIVVDRPLP